MKKTGRKTHLTPNEVATLLMVNPVTVRQWAARGLLRAVMTPGGHRRFLLSDVEEFARSRGTLTRESARRNRPVRVLVVDDDPQAAQFTAALIARRAPDVTIEIANDGFDAGSKTEAFRPNAVILDLMMPGMDGFEVCRRLRERPSFDDIRIIAITGHHVPDNIERVLKAGANACLAKPLNPEKLLAELGLIDAAEVNAQE